MKKKILQFRRNTPADHQQKATIYAATHGSRYHDILRSTIGILFLGTPFRGSFATGAAKWPILYNQLLGQETSRLQIQVLEKKTHLLEDLLRKFSEIAREPWLNLPIVCAYETKPTQILKAVFPSWSLPKGKNIVSCWSLSTASRLDLK